MLTIGGCGNMTEQDKQVVIDKEYASMKKTRKLHSLGFKTKVTYTNIGFIEKIEKYAENNRKKLQ